MKTFMMAVLVAISTQSAFASNTLLDKALDANLAEKKELQVEHSQAQGRPKKLHPGTFNSKYEIIEVGDEMGSFAAVHPPAYHKDAPVLNEADAGKELKDINAEISDSTL